jgi:spore cortex formation protein SpoVR/YcgB (stage V sporulation)
VDTVGPLVASLQSRRSLAAQQLTNRHVEEKTEFFKNKNKYKYQMREQEKTPRYFVACINS